MKKNLPAVIEIILWVVILIYVIFNIVHSHNFYYCSILDICFAVVYLVAGCGLIYFNKYCLIPRFLLKNRVFEYAIILISLVVVLGILDILATQRILSTLFENMTEKAVHDNAVIICINIILRNLAVISIFFILHVSEYFMNLYHKKEKAISAAAGIIPIFLKNNKIYPVQAGHILFAQCQRNVTTFYMTDGQEYKLYESLSGTEELIGSDKCLRINRNTLVLYENITSYNTQEVFVTGREEGLPFYTNSQEKVFYLLFKWDSSKCVEDSMKKLPKNEDLAELEPVSEDENEAFGGIGIENSEENEGQNTVQENDIQVCAFIRQNPKSKAQQITDGTGIPLRTVERILQQLKDEDKIFYAGSKRYGGYRVKEQD